MAVSITIEARALYAEYAILWSRDGAVRLRGAQGYTKVRTVKGDVEVARLYVSGVVAAKRVAVGCGREGGVVLGMLFCRARVQNGVSALGEGYKRGRLRWK